MPRIAHYKIRKDEEAPGKPRDLKEIMRDISEESAKTLPDQKRIAELFSEKRNAMVIKRTLQESIEDIKTSRRRTHKEYPELFR